jgi:hypothetical protein
MNQNPSELNIHFSATITKEEKSGWVCVVWSGSKEVLGTGRPVRVRGTLDGTPFEVTLMPFGNGDHFIPVKADMRKLLKKTEGDVVEVALLERVKG